MSQSSVAASDNQGELDPLLAFNAEFTAAEPLSSQIDPPPAAAGDHILLRGRLEHAERSLERARVEIASLKSSVATLVSAVDDIKKRLSRPIAPHPLPKVAHRHGLGRAAAVMIVIVVLTLGIAMWGAASIALVDVAQPQPVNTDSALPPPPPELMR